MQEIWRPVVGYEGVYEVSNLGRVKMSECKIIYRGREGVLWEKLLSTQVVNNYLVVSLMLKNTRKGQRRNRHFLIHRLVAEAFIPNPEDKLQVNHLDSNRQNNCVENLEWCTHKENMEHSARGDRRKNEGCVNSKPIYQYDLKGNLIKKWPSQSEIQRQNIAKQPKISKAIKDSTPCYGFIWKFA